MSGNIRWCPAGLVEARHVGASGEQRSHAIGSRRQGAVVQRRAAGFIDSAHVRAGQYQLHAAVATAALGGVVQGR